MSKIIDHIEEVRAFRAQCCECMDEDFWEDDDPDAKRHFLKRIMDRGWIVSEEWVGLLCPTCAKERKEE